MGGKSVLLTDNPGAELNSFCRLCVEYSTEQTLFASSSATAALFNRIFECTGVRLFESPDLPKRICDVCTSQLVICERFIKKCREAEQNFINWQSKREAALVDSDPPAPLVVPEQQSNQECNTLKLEELVNVNPGDGKSEEELIMVEVLDTHPEYEIDLPDNQDVPEEGIVKHKKQDVPVEIHHEQNSATISKKKNRIRVSKTECPECGKMQQNLKQHMLVHTGEKRHVCPYCSKAFSQKGNLTHHINQHTGNAPYKCDQCGKAFTDPQSLRSHKLVHTDERRYGCQECGDTFKYKNSLAVHLRGHNQDRRFSCEDCRKSFISSTSLKKHIRTHTGERPYPCTVCSKTFKTPSSLTLHKLLHTKERRFQCDICERWFSYKHVLKAHMNIHLRERNESPQSERQADIEG